MGTNIRFKPTGEGDVDKLIGQLVKVMKNCNQKSKNTRWKYYYAMKPFLRFCAYEFKMQNIRNIHQKHLDAYIAYRKGTNQNVSERTRANIKSRVATKTIKGDLSAVRFWHRQIPRAKNNLLENNQLKIKLDATPENKKQDKYWTNEEVDKMVKIARDCGRDKIADIILFQRYTGFRVHEVIKIDRAMAEDYIRNLKLSIVGKGGRKREFGIAVDNQRKDGAMLLHTKEIISLLERTLANNPERGKKLFIEEGKNARQMQDAVMHFIKRHRHKVEGKDIKEGKRERLVSHGLRHSKMRDEFAIRMAQSGVNVREIKQQVSRIAGHYRPQVTNVYLGPLGRFRLKKELVKSNDFKRTIRSIKKHFD